MDFKKIIIAAMFVLTFLGWRYGFTTRLEAFSFVTGVLGVWLTVNQSVWNFPVGLFSVATFSVVFFESGLFADAGLQLVYFILTSLGWYLWVFGGNRHSRLRVTQASRREISVVVAACFVLTLCFWRMLSHWSGPASFWDSFTTAASLGGQWLLNRKKLESWWFWIVVDIIYVPLYLFKALYLTAFLYLLFVGLAVAGYREWKKNN
jgi:nicotinamide mononucleotide transporter